MHARVSTFTHAWTSASQSTGVAGGLMCCMHGEKHASNNTSQSGAYPSGLQPRLDQQLLLLARAVALRRGARPGKGDGHAAGLAEGALARLLSGQALHLCMQRQGTHLSDP